MLIKKYATIVSRTDQYRDLPRAKRREITIFGLASEIGSLVSAIKKEQLKEGGALNSNIARAEVKEELGDVIWYAFLLAQIENGDGATDILEVDIANLRAELEKKNPRTSRIHEVLPQKVLDAFLQGAAEFPSIKSREFHHYQDLAFLTARTKGETLHNVCCAVLPQLGAQLMRLLLPDIERELNKQLVDREPLVILGEIAWHLSALARLYDIDLDDVAELNAQKASFRRRDGRLTPFHDASYDENERFPRDFDIEFRPVDARTSQMTRNGKQLGNNLTDNAHEPDGYRFHDVMHLAFIAHFGWSPVLRKFMDLKREDDETDDVEDGGRAKILEEMLILFIHIEGTRRAEKAEPELPAEARRMFPDDGEIPFGFLKKVHEMAKGYEPYENKYWEWENAIRDGYRMYHALCQAKQGTVRVDLNERKLTFIPE